MIKILYFTHLREQMGVAEEPFTLPAGGLYDH